MEMMFQNRQEAAMRIAELMAELAPKNPVVFGIPRGGVVVAFKTAEKLKAPLDIVAVRKLGVPQNPELAFGAIAPGNITIIDQDTVDRFVLSANSIKEVIKNETAEINRRLEQYRGTEEMPDLKGKTAILIDDGIATGLTTRAAYAYLEKLKPAQIIVATPVCSSDVDDNLREKGMELYCLLKPELMFGVGQFYQDFPQTTDEEVMRLLHKKKNS